MPEKSESDVNFFERIPISIKVIFRVWNFFPKAKQLGAQPCMHPAPPLQLLRIPWAHKINSTSFQFVLNNTTGQLTTLDCYENQLIVQNISCNAAISWSCALQWRSQIVSGVYRCFNLVRTGLVIVTSQCLLSLPFSEVDVKRFVVWIGRYANLFSNHCDATVRRCRTTASSTGSRRRSARARALRGTAINGREPRPKVLCWW